MDKKSGRLSAGMIRRQNDLNRKISELHEIHVKIRETPVEQLGSAGRSIFFTQEEDLKNQVRKILSKPLNLNCISGHAIRMIMDIHLSHPIMPNEKLISTLSYTAWN